MINMQAYVFSYWHLDQHGHKFSLIKNVAKSGRIMSQTNTSEGVDYGPIAVLIVTQTGEKAVYKSPELDGEDRNFFMR